MSMHGMDAAALKIASDWAYPIDIGFGKFIRTANETFGTVEWKEVEEYGKRKEVDTESGEPKAQGILYAHE